MVRPRKKITDDMREKAIALILNGTKRTEVAKEMGMSYDTWLKYLREHPAFGDAIENALDAAIDRVEDCLLSRAQGYEYTERVTVTKVDGGTKDADGRIVGGKWSKEERVSVKYLPPDVGACQYMLNNRRRQTYNRTLEANLANPPSVQLIMNIVPAPRQIEGVIVEALPSPVEEENPVPKPPKVLKRERNPLASNRKPRQPKGEE